MTKLDITFRVFWLAAVFLVLLSLNFVFGLGNVNWIERSVFFCAGVFFVLKNPRSSNLVLSGFGLSILTIFVSSLFTDFPWFTWERMLSAVTALVSIHLFFLAKPTHSDRLFILKTLAAMTPILVLYGFLLNILIGRPVYMQDHTGALRYGAGTIPAFLAGAAYTSCIAYSMLFRYSQEIKYIFLVFGSLFISVLSGSRMPTVCALICIFVIIFSSIKDSLGRIVFVFTGLIVVSTGLLTFGSQLLIRFSSESASGRDLLWKSVLVWADRYPWTGVGYGHHMLLIPDYLQKITKTQATHNEYVRLIAELGYVGAVVFVISIAVMYYGSVIKQNLSDFFVAIMVLGTFFLFSYSDNTLISTYCMAGPLAFCMGSGLTSSPPPKKKKLIKSGDTTLIS